MLMPPLLLLLLLPLLLLITNSSRPKWRAPRVHGPFQWMSKSKLPLQAPRRVLFTIRYKISKS